MAGSIFIPDSAKERPQQAILVAVDSGVLLESGERLPSRPGRGAESFWHVLRLRGQGRRRRVHGSARE